MKPSIFWLHSRMIDRLRAEEDLRVVRLLASPTSNELYQTVTKTLIEEMGKVTEADQSDKYEVVIDEKTGQDKNFDREGLMALKQDLM